MEYYKRYKNLFKKAQKTGQYKIYAFDVKNSKSFVKQEGAKFYYAILKFLKQTTLDLLNLEKEKGHKILHRHLTFNDLKENEKIADKVVLFNGDKQGKDLSQMVLRIDQLNPLYWLGDAVHFIVYRNSISDKEFFDIFKKNKNKLLPKYDFHFASAYYETDVWSESNEKLSRVYCLPILEELMKENKEKSPLKPKDIFENKL